MQVKITEEIINSVPVCYMRRTGAYGAENYRLMERFKNWLKEQKRYQDDTVIYAVALDNPEITEAAKCRYDVCTPDNGGGVTKEVECRTLEGGKYAVLRIDHTPEAVMQAWTQCFEILEKNQYCYDTSRLIMERYKKKMVEEHYCELCVPVL